MDNNKKQKLSETLSLIDLTMKRAKELNIELTNLLSDSKDDSIRDYLLKTNFILDELKASETDLYNLIKLKIKGIY